MYHQIIKIVWKNKGQNALLLLEIFISFVILAAVFAYLFNNFQKLNAPLGFETKDRWMVLFGDYYIKKDSLAYVQEVDNLRRNLDNMPEVKSHSFGNMVYPFSWNNWSSITEVNNIKLEYKLAAYDDEFNNTMEVPIVEGRWYNKPLQTNDIDEVVVNNVFKNLYFPDKNIIDSVFNLNGDKKIVGIIENFKYNGEFTVEDPIAISYQSPYNKEQATCLYLQMQENTPTIVEEKINKLITQTTGSTNFTIKNLDEERIRGSRMTWVTLIAISLVALFLVINVAMGLFGVLWYNINKRRYEISLRKAMGATEGKIMQQFIIEILGLSMLAIGLGSLVISQVAYFNLIGFFDKDKLYTGMMLAIVFISVLVLACAIYPSYKAARMHPADGLKEE